MEKENNKNLPMNWWNFCKYFRFPVSILVWIIAILNMVYYISIDISELGILSTLSLLFYLGYLIFLIITYINFINETAVGYKLLIFSLFVELIINSLLYSLPNINDSSFTQSFILSSAIYGWAYVWPNFIYFTKRSYVFNKKITTIQNENNEQNNVLDSSMSNIRYCTNCGEKIDMSWNFCNYCGFKLNK